MMFAGSECCFCVNMDPFSDPFSLNKKKLKKSLVLLRLYHCENGEKNGFTRVFR